MSDDARLIGIEEKIAYMEKYTSDLNEVIQRNAMELTTLRKLLERLEHRMDRMENPPTDAKRTLEEDRPPHW